MKELKQQLYFNYKVLLYFNFVRMHRDNGRKSFLPRTPITHRNDDNFSRPSLASGFHQRMYFL